MKYSIGIVTYVKRYESYFTKLIKQIKLLRPDVEIIVCVNGEHKQKFDQKYRSEMLRFLSNYKNVYPSFYPNFRSLSKLWNCCLINSSNDNILLLNDDITIVQPEFFNMVEQEAKLNQSFKLNGSWSHVYLNRKEVYEVGWFDERYLGVGEEDGDFEWRWNKTFGRPIKNIAVTGIHNYVEQNDCLADIEKVNNKYSKFNRQFRFNEKYKKADDGEKFGIMDTKVICVNPTLPQHLPEKFYWDNKDKL